jgi:predicted MFS family arabinose efflux permease
MIVFLLGIAFAETSFTMTMVQVPIYLRELGADIRQVGFFITIALTSPLILRIFGGWLSDAIGRLRAIWIGCIAGTVGYVPYALAPTWQFALLGPVLLAVTTALIAPSYRAYIADSTAESFRGQIFGLTESFRTLAWIVVRPPGGLLAQYFGYRSIFYAAIIAYAIATIFLIISRRSEKPHEPARCASEDRSLRTSFSEMMARFLSGGLVMWLLITDGVRDVAGLSKQSIGFLDSMQGVTWAATSALAGWLVDRLSERLGVVIGLATLILSRLSFAFALGFLGVCVLMNIVGDRWRGSGSGAQLARRSRRAGSHARHHIRNVGDQSRINLPAVTLDRKSNLERIWTAQAAPCDGDPGKLRHPSRLI